MKILYVFIALVVMCSSINDIAFAQSHLIKMIELNNEKEYVLIQNEGDSVVNLNGWVLHDHDYGKTKIYSYTFSNMQLKPSEILQMQSGKTKKEQKETPNPGKLEHAHRYILWSNRKVWNDRCDIAYLLDNKGNLIDEKQSGGDLEKGKKEHCR